MDDLGGSAEGPGGCFGETDVFDLSLSAGVGEASSLSTVGRGMERTKEMFAVGLSKRFKTGRNGRLRDVLTVEPLSGTPSSSQ